MHKRVHASVQPPAGTSTEQGSATQGNSVRPREGRQHGPCYHTADLENRTPRGRSQTCKATAACCHSHEASEISEPMGLPGAESGGISGAANGQEVSFGAMMSWNWITVTAVQGRGCAFNAHMPCTLENGEGGECQVMSILPQLNKKSHACCTAPGRRGWDTRVATRAVIRTLTS